jgi:hypothetical protein
MLHVLLLLLLLFLLLSEFSAAAVSHPAAAVHRTAHASRTL